MRMTLQLMPAHRGTGVTLYSSTLGRVACVLCACAYLGVVWVSSDTLRSCVAHCGAAVEGLRLALGARVVCV